MSKPTTVAVAVYADKSAAKQDFDAVWGDHHEGQLDHVAAALISKDSKGKLHIDRHDTTAKHDAWGAGIIGAASLVIAGPVGVGLAAGAGGLVGHYWHNIPKDDCKKMGALLEDGDSGMVVVAVNPKGSDVGALLANAASKIVTNNVSDTDGALEQAFEETSAPT